MKVDAALFRFTVRTCRSQHECALCDKKISYGQDYHDGGYGKRAHVTCARVQRDKLQYEESIKFAKAWFGEQ